MLSCKYLPAAVILIMEFQMFALHAHKHMLVSL